jgi:hypothetical protein
VDTFVTAVRELLERIPGGPAGKKSAPAVASRRSSPAKRRPT